MLLSHSQRGSLGHVEENKSRAFHFQIVPLEMSGANSVISMQTCAAVNEHRMKDSWGDGELTLNSALLSSLERLHMLQAWRGRLEKGVFSAVCRKRMVNTAVLSQWNGCHTGTLCVHNCSLEVQQWSLTPNGIHSLALSTLKSSLLYIKHHVSEIHLDSYTFFYFFFFPGLYHTLRSFINELAGCLHHETCLSMARAR